MRAALLIAVLVAVGLSAALAVRTWRRHPDAPTVERCDARAAPPPPLLPELSGNGGRADTLPLLDYLLGN